MAAHTHDNEHNIQRTTQRICRTHNLHNCVIIIISHTTPPTHHDTPPNNTRPAITTHLNPPKKPKKVQALYQYDCLRANKSTMAWGVEARVPFLDRDFLDVAMAIDPADKMIDKAAGALWVCVRECVSVCVCA
jgi:hypothetical protein